MQNVSRILTLFLYAAVWSVIAACQSQAVSPLITTVPSPTPLNETLEPSLSPTLIQVTPSPPSIITTPTSTLSPTTIQATPSQPPFSPTPAPTWSPPPEETSEPAPSRNDHTPYSFANPEEIKIGKLSGIVFHPQRETFFGVGDKGHVSEFESGGILVKQERVRKGADFEGITYNPTTRLLYVAVEGDEVILEIDPNNLQVVRDIPIDRVFDGRVLLDPKGNGVEGITFVPSSGRAIGGTFYLVNQSNNLGGKDPSIVFEVEIVDSETETKARIVRYFGLGFTDLSGIQYDPSSRQLLVLSDDNDLLIEVSMSGQVRQVYPLPGESQEGIALDEDGFLYIAQDSEKGLLRFGPAEP